MIINYSELQKLESEEQRLKNQQRKNLTGKNHDIEGNFVACLGRQIDPDNTVLKVAKPLFGGIYIKYNDMEMLVDPGVNIVKRLGSLGLNLSKINNLFISHAHIDHDHDADVVLELLALNDSAYNFPVSVLLSQKSLSECAVHPYHFKKNQTRFLAKILKDKENIKINDDVNLVPVEVVHSVDGTYGFVLEMGGLKIGYTGDTGFSETFKTTEGEYKIGEDAEIKGEIVGPGSFNENLRKIFSNVDILIFNLHNLSYKKNSLHHSSVFDLIQILKNSNVNICICDHFDPEPIVGSQYPKDVVSFIKQETGKDVRLVGMGGLVTRL